VNYGMEISKTAYYGCMRLYGCRPKSVSAGLSCGLAWTMALYEWTSSLPFVYRRARSQIQRKESQQKL